MTFSGVYVPLITPFGADGEVAAAALERLAHEVLDGGARGLVALGTTAEHSALSEAERNVVVDVVARVCRERRAQLIVGANHAGDLARVPDSASAVLSLVPPFVRAGEDGVVAYLADLAARSPVPVLVYHVPVRTAQVLPVAALRRIAALDNVAGIKLAAGGIDTDVVALLADPPPGFAVLAGDDAFFAPLLTMGAHGGILASAHVATSSFVALAAGAGDRARELARLSLALFAAPNPTVIKAVLHAQGRIPTPDVRLPLLLAAEPITVAACRSVKSLSPDPAPDRTRSSPARTGHCG